MPTEATLLDSSPLIEEGGTDAAGPPQRKSLKRTASTAALLTPPRTIRRNAKRGTRRLRSGSDASASPRSTRSSPRSRASAASEPETTPTDGGDDESSFGSGGRRLGGARKKRRVGELDRRLEALIESIDEGDGDAETAFWTAGPSKADESVDEEGKKPQRARTTSPVRVEQTVVQAPLSPPPSKRNKRIGRRAIKTKELPPLPSTPKGKKRKEGSPVRDSPNNPFLVDDDSPASVTYELAEPRTPTTHAEKPTITYVFRGKRATFANPMYNLSPEVHARSLLPIEHPDYSPDPACPPKLLFPAVPKRRPPTTPTRSSKRIRAQSGSPGRRHAGEEWNDSDGEDVLRVTPPRRLFH